MIASLTNLVSIKRVAAAMVSWVIALCPASGQPREQKPATIADLRNAIEAVLQETRTPGAGIAIVSRDKIEWAAGLGVADVARKTPATAETLFRIGSISKSFAALAVLKLQEEGKLKLSDTVKQWVPEVVFSNRWEATDPVRLVHLLEHTAGFEDMHPREYALNDPTPIALKDALAYGADSRVSQWRPGTRMAYCNSAPAVVAAVIEKVSGQRYEDYVKENFFKPLHMDGTSYFYTTNVEQRLTKLYHPDGVTPYPFWNIAFRSSGALNASANDIANYLRFYLQRGSLDGTQLLQPSSIERMETMETLPSTTLGKIDGYGLFNDMLLEGPFVFRGHGGAVIGGVAQIAYLPKEGRGFAVMINSGSFPAIYKISKLVGHYAIRDLTPPTLPAVAPLSDELKQHYGGYFQAISPRMPQLYGFWRLTKIQKLSFTGEGLSTSVHGIRRERWLPVSEKLFRRADQSAATLALLLDADGEILIQHTDWETLKKVPGLRVWSQLIAIALVALLVLSSLFFAPIWIWRKLSGKLRDAGPLSVRVLPLLGAILLVTFDVLLAIAFRGMITSAHADDLGALGVPSFLTIGLMLSSIAFALATVASLYVLYRERTAAMNRVVYWHSLAVTGGLLGVAIYYGYWGLIGVRLWA